MDKFKKYLNEDDIVNPDRKTMDLVHKVANHIEWRGDKAAEFIYLLLEDINFHSEASEIYNMLMRRMGR